MSQKMVVMVMRVSVRAVVVNNEQPQQQTTARIILVSRVNYSFVDVVLGQEAMMVKLLT